MLPGNVDPRRPDKVQRYVAKPSNANGHEDLTPDYMNLLGQHATTANAAEVSDKHIESSVTAEPNPQLVQPHHAEEVHSDEQDCLPAVSTNATNVIPTSPQYGVAIITNSNDIPTETMTASTDTITDTTAKPPDDNKELHSTPSKNDRFKVVKIASLEPFKRGRWKCMDYVDEAPPPTVSGQQTKVTQSTGSLQMAGAVYLQTQSLPQQQIQQMLMQGGFTNGTQFFPNIPAQLIQPQYFYPQVTNMQTQTLPQQVPSSMPAQFINSGQPYFSAGVVPNAASFTMPQGYQNVQYVPANIIPNQSSAFVPTSQTVQLTSNFQQSQTYAGQPNVTQSNVAQPMVNGHAYPQQNEQQATAASLPTQTAKSVILNTSVPQSVVSSQAQMTQPQTVQNQILVQSNTQSQTVPVIQSQQFPQNPSFQQQQVASQPTQTQNTSQAPNIQVIPGPALIQVPQGVPVQSHMIDQSLASNVYTNPQFAMSVNSLTVLEENSQENSAETVTEPSASTGDQPSESADDPAKTNPVVNAIDNKIEQAMDLVKSHLMYTVREEVEVLKEKIAELMEKIQQLETENNYLRSQIPKNQTVTPTSNPNPVTVSSQTSVTVNNASPNPAASSQNPPSATGDAAPPQQQQQQQ